MQIVEYFNRIVEYLNSIEDIELYYIILLLFFTIWFIFNTIKYSRGEKRKVKNLHRFANEGEVDAQHHLAHCYHKGKIVKKNCQKAAFLYQKAAFSGNEEAKGYLQKFLENSKNRKWKKC